MWNEFRLSLPNLLRPSLFCHFPETNKTAAVSQFLFSPDPDDGMIPLAAKQVKTTVGNNQTATAKYDTTQN